MNQHDWEEYFEAVNGRKPEQTDVEAAREAGEFQNERGGPAPLPQMSQVPGPPQGTEQSVPAVASATGQPVAAGSPQPWVQQQPVPGPARAAGIFCTNCGTSLPPGSQFCTTCGTKVADAPVGVGSIAGPPFASASAGSSDAAGMFFSQLGAWILSALKTPMKADSADGARFGWISLVLVSILSSLVPATLGWRAVAAVGSYATNGLSSLLAYSMLQSSQSYVNSATSTANGAVTGAFFGMALGFFAFNMAVVLCVWVVRHTVLLDSEYSFNRAIAMIGRQYVLVSLILLVTEFFALVAVPGFVVFLLVVCVAITNAIIGFGIFQGENHRNADGFYLRLAGYLGTILVLAVAIAFMSFLGFSTLLASL